MDRENLNTIALENTTSCIRQTSLVTMAIIYIFNDLKILPQVIRET